MSTSTAEVRSVVKKDGRWFVKLEKTGNEIPAGGYASEAQAGHLLSVLEEHRDDLRDEFDSQDTEDEGEDKGADMERTSTQSTIERRSFAGKVEFRAAPEGSTSPGTIVGYAAVFNSPSEDLGGFIEKIAPGAFSRAIASDDIRALRNHEPESLLGRLASGTLRLSQDAHGLRMEIDLPDTTAGRDTAESVRRGDMSGCSFSFDPRGYEWNFDSEPPVRTLKDVGLLDVGPVTFPAYRDTSVALRSLEAHRPKPAIPLDLLKAKIRLAEAF